MPSRSRCTHYLLGVAQVIEHAFKNETVGLVTREQFVEKRLTIEERLKEEEKRRRHEAEEEALWVRLAGRRCVSLTLEV
jgi:hypothetical protein